MSFEYYEEIVSILFLWQRSTFQSAVFDLRSSILHGVADYLSGHCKFLKKTNILLAWFFFQLWTPVICLVLVNVWRHLEEFLCYSEEGLLQFRDEQSIKWVSTKWIYDGNRFLVFCCCDNEMLSCHNDRRRHNVVCWRKETVAKKTDPGDFNERTLFSFTLPVKSVYNFAIWFNCYGHGRWSLLMSAHLRCNGRFRPYSSVTTCDSSKETRAAKVEDKNGNAETSA